MIRVIPRQQIVRAADITDLENGFPCKRSPSACSLMRNYNHFPAASRSALPSWELSASRRFSSIALLQNQDPRIAGKSEIPHPPCPRDLRLGHRHPCTWKPRRLSRHYNDSWMLHALHVLFIALPTLHTFSDASQRHYEGHLWS